MEKESLGSAEHLPRVEHEAKAALERLEASHEQLANHENRVEQAEAARREIQAQPEPQQQSEAGHHKSHVSGLDRITNYRDTMRSVRRQLTPASRAFSRFIHNPPIERASEVLEVTVMRPSVTLGATLTALIVGGTFFFTAHRYGFKLRGSEFVLSLLVGAVLGYVIELAWRSVSRLVRPNR